MPAGTVHEHDGVGIALHTTADFIEMLLHGMGVGPRHHQSGADAPGRTDGAEQIGAFVSLVRRLARPGSAFRPQAHLAVLLADPGLVLEPDFYCLALRQMAYVGLERSAEVFLNASMTLVFWPGWRGLALIWEKPRAVSSLETVRS